jgi:hypothetical protein
MRLLITFILGAALVWPQIIILPKKKAAAASGAGFLTSAAAYDATPGGATTLASGAFNVTAGSLIHVVVWGSDYTTTAVSCNSQSATDTGLAFVADGYYARVWYVANANSGTGVTCTATYGGYADYRRILVTTWSGIATSSPYHNGTCNTSGCNAVTATATTRTTANVTTTTANTAHIAVFLNWDVLSNYTAETNYTKVVEVDDGVTDAAILRNVTSTGTYPSATVATSSSTDKYMGFYTTWVLAN